MLRFTFMLTLLAALLPGCRPTPSASTATPPPPPNEATEVVNKYWKLITLEGQPVRMAADQEREAFFILRDSSQVTGFGGCNVINGRYTLEPGNRLRFSQMLTTLKACPGVEGEAAFTEVLGLTDNYTVRNDTLRLNVGRRAPLAVFQAVYF